MHAKPPLHLKDFINAALEINPSQTLRKRTPKMTMAGGRLQESNRKADSTEKRSEDVFSWKRSGLICFLEGIYCMQFLSYNSVEVPSRR